ncbi:hypothetical protein EBU99_11880 [bacterium]|nr:hypothetical protein [bacterium]
MKLQFSVSALACISSFALAETPTAPAASAPAASAPVASAPVATPATKVSMRMHLDPFYKNINDAAKNYKTPKLESLRIMFERDLGQNSKADVELRLHELENTKAAYFTKDANNKTIVNTDVVKYFHLLYKPSALPELELGFVREYHPGLYGYTDKPKSTNVVEPVAFTGHLNRIEGYRVAYDTGWNALKVTYHIARNPILDETTLGQKPADTTWYHQVTSDFKVGDAAVQAGLGTQGHWLPLTEKDTLKSDSFFHLQAEQKVDALKIKAGVAYDTYAIAKQPNSDGQVLAGTAVATTLIAAAKYEVMPKEFMLIAELDYRSLKSAKETTNFSETPNGKTDSTNEVAFTLAGQYMLDDKLSLIPAYGYYNSPRSQANTANGNGEAVLKDRTQLVSGAERKPAKYEQSIGVRIRYDY